VALHEGVLPGYPASHGCIRMSHDFAQKLWPITNLGVRVIVTHHDLAPVEFTHPKLFAPKLKPPAPAIAMDGGSEGRTVAPAIVMAQATIPDAAIDAIDAAPQAEATKPAADATDDRNAAEVAMPPVQMSPAVAEPRPAEAAPSSGDVVKPAPAVDPAKPVAPPIKAADQPTKRTGQVAVFVSRKEQKLFVRQGLVPLFGLPVVIDQPDQPLGTHVFTAMEVTDNGSGMRWNLMTVPTDPSAPTEQKDTGKKSKETPKETPKPAVRLKPPATAAQALDRIQIPQEAADRISELLIPGSSLVVSDEGLGRETGRYTEFIVLSR
jgi:hypothetical protein